MAAGGGFIGVGVIVKAKYRGAKVIALGRKEYRMDLARKLGVDYMINPNDTNWLDQVYELIGYLRDVDASFECYGYPYYQYRCLERVRRYSKMDNFGAAGYICSLTSNFYRIEK